MVNEDVTETVLAMTAFNGKIWVGCNDNAIRIFDLSGCLMTCLGHQGVVECFLEVDGTVWSGSWDQTIRIWSSEGQCIGVCTGHTNAVEFLMPIGDHVWSGSWDCTICIWDRTGQCKRVCHGHQVSFVERNCAL